jgi:hypothetical protein
MVCFCLELEVSAADPLAPILLRALVLLVEPEEQVQASSAAIRQQVAGTNQARALAEVIAAIVIPRFNGRSDRRYRLVPLAVSLWTTSAKAWLTGRYLDWAGKRPPSGPCRRSGWRRRRGDPNATAN